MSITNYRGYVITPYTGGSDSPMISKRIELERVLAVTQWVAAATHYGFWLYSPIIHAHPVVEFGLPGDEKFWKKINENEMGRSDYVIDLRLPEFGCSKGRTRELEHANTLLLNVWIAYPRNDIEVLAYDFGKLKEWLESCIAPKLG